MMHHPSPLPGFRCGDNKNSIHSKDICTCFSTPSTPFYFRNPFVGVTIEPNIKQTTTTLICTFSLSLLCVGSMFAVSIYTAFALPEIDQPGDAQVFLVAASSVPICAYVQQTSKKKLLNLRFGSLAQKLADLCAALQIQ